jgi:hypothetical protein
MNPSQFNLFCKNYYFIEKNHIKKSQIISHVKYSHSKNPQICTKIKTKSPHNYFNFKNMKQINDIKHHIRFF